jgi:hypothetical protein
VIGIIGEAGAFCTYHAGALRIQGITDFPKKGTFIRANLAHQYPVTGAGGIGLMILIESDGTGIEISVFLS